MANKKNTANMPQLHITQQSLSYLQGAKNLLAFSGGMDSSALFFVLLEHDICFDIAIIDYGIRAQSKEEVRYATSLATTYKKHCHTLAAKAIGSDFESRARTIRYDFFHKLIATHCYDNLITAHHFDDRLEWFFMQLCSGAGLNTLLGFQEVTQHIATQHGAKQRPYHIIRPLIAYTKQQIQAYNDAHKIHYFLDSSNEDTRYERNFFRKHITTLLSERFQSGLQRSFEFLGQERGHLYPPVIVCRDYNLFSFRLSSCRSYAHEIHTIDMLAKRLGYLLSSKQKEELAAIIERDESCVMGGRIVIAKNEELLFVGIESSWLLRYYKGLERIQEARYIQTPMNLEQLYHILPSATHNTIVIPKKQRDIYRIQKIPPKIRPLLYINSLDIW